MTAVFDVLGTLFGLGRLRARLCELGAPAQALELWFSQSLRDYFARSHAGGYVPLKKVLEAELPRSLRVFGVDSTQGARAHVIGGLTELDPAPGADEACTRLRDAGWRLVALSNGSLEATTTLLERAGLIDAFAAVRSCDEAAASKPAAAAYKLALDRAEGSTWMVAAHAWDVAGAREAGMRGAWVATIEGEYLSAYPRPDVEASDLVDAVQRVLAWQSGTPLPQRRWPSS